MRLCGHCFTPSEQWVAETRAAGRGGGVRTCARTAPTRIQKCQSSPPTRSSPCCHRCHWPVCHPRSMPPNSHCDREISAHESIKPERQKICEQKTCEQKTYSPECPDNVDSNLLVVKFQKKLKRKKKKTYPYLCPVNVDWHLNEPVESMPQIRTV